MNIRAHLYHQYECQTDVYYILKRYIIQHWS